MKCKKNHIIKSILIIELIIRIIYFSLTFPNMILTIKKWNESLEEKKNTIRCEDKNNNYTEHTCIISQTGHELRDKIELQIGGIIFTILSIINPIWLLLNILFKVLLLSRFISFFNIELNNLFLFFNSFNMISGIIYINYLQECLTNS
jgi:hypothetical protein